MKSKTFTYTPGPYMNDVQITIQQEAAEGEKWYYWEIVGSNGNATSMEFDSASECEKNAKQMASNYSNKCMD